MNFQDIQVIDNGTIGNSFKKRDFMIIYHQQAANLNDSDENIDFVSAKIIIIIKSVTPIFNMKWQKKDVAVAANRVRANGDTNRLVKSAFGFCFRKARLSTTGTGDFEHNKNVGRNSTITRALTSKYEDSLSHFGKIYEWEAQIENTSIKVLPINNHDVAAKKRQNETTTTTRTYFRFLLNI